MIVARSGIGIYRNYAGTSSGSLECMPNVYGRTLLSDSLSKWDFSRFIPDIICINLGTNDVSTPGYKTDMIRDAYSKFLIKTEPIIRKLK